MTETKIAVKTYSQNGEVIVAACDEGLLDQTFEEGELHLQVHSSFYDGNRVDEEELLQHLNNSTSANLVGENVINSAIKAGLISDDCIIRIQGIPHAQIYKMR